jgi:hypothetical protein
MTDLVPTDTSEFRAQGFGDWSRMDGNSNSAHDHTSGAMTGHRQLNSIQNEFGHFEVDPSCWTVWRPS